MRETEHFNYFQTMFHEVAEKARPRRFCVDSDGVYHLPDGVYHLPGELEAEKDALDRERRTPSNAWARIYWARFYRDRPDFLPFLLGSR